MLEKGKISSIALVFLLIDLVGATAVVFLPALTAKFAGRDAWLVPVISTIPGIVVIMLVTELGRRFPGKTIIEYLQIILGNWPGKAVAVLYIFFFIHTNGVIIRQFGELITTMMMPHTPIVVLHTIFVLLAAYAVRSGLEVIGRLWELTFPWVFILYVILLLFSFQKAEFHRLLPVLENGFKPVLQGSITPSAWRGEVMILAMFLPYLAEPSQGRRMGIWSVIIIGAILIADAVLNTAIFGPSTSRQVFPSFTIVNEMVIGGFLRVDIAIVIIWLVTMLIKIALFYYAAVLGTAQLLNMKDYKPITLPIGVILTALSILSIENSTGIPAYATTGYPPFAYLVELVIPLAVLLIAAGRGLKPKY
ncbi:Spore germination protein YndE [Pelotomaculum sp. FP]|uniref:GerAB/ArcD/ProY family transporter n=1 Tax=Pelotomaculum sp. FP TaxID=261474 RepID=UPI0010661329|nr:endospore germination permease [Pelotomaculum sp. FP]TEB16471.1 Spore germination protein YndE [Pelotomaculum sp. FP]